MSIIDFTNATCKNNNIMNKQIMENFEEHFAMYSLNNIKNIPNIEANADKGYFIIKGTEEEIDEIIDKFSSYTCSHFNHTLKPVFSKTKKGLKVNFKIQ